MKSDQREEQRARAGPRRGSRRTCRPRRRTSSKLEPMEASMDHELERTRRRSVLGAPGRSYARSRGMTSFPTVRVAAVQATPVILDAEATVAKAVRAHRRGGRRGRAARRCCPRPSSRSTLERVGGEARRRSAASTSCGSGCGTTPWTCPGPLVDRLAAACREHGVDCAIGVNEREAARPGTLYNTLLLLGPGRPAGTPPQAACRRCTSGSSTASARATTSTWSTRRSAASAG